MTRPLALVTGGWRRIGAAIAQALAGSGWDLVLHAHHAESRDPAVEGKLAEAGAVVHFVHGDLADARFTGALVGEAARLAGRAPTLLVNCASLFGSDTVADVTGDTLAAHFAVNVHAPVLLTRALADALGEQPGAVVHVLDQRVVNPVPDQLSYTLSKQALHASVRTLARALAPRIRVNGVAPGLTLPTGDYDAAQWERLAGIMPLRHLPAPGEIAEAVVYLAGARSVTGQTLFVDAGANLEAYPRDFVYLEA